MLLKYLSLEWARDRVPHLWGEAWMYSARASVSGVIILRGELTGGERDPEALWRPPWKRDAEGVFCLRARD